MTNVPKLPPALAFLNWVQESGSKKYQNPSWLLTEFENNRWICKFKSTVFEINYDIKLPDNSLLINEKYEQVVLVFKTWLTVQTHPDATGGRKNSSITSFHKVSEVLRLIDFLLINNNRYRILENGFSLTTASDLKSILGEVSTSARSMNSIYQWHKNISAFAKTVINELPEEIRAKILSEKPEIVQVDIFPDDIVLDLCRQKIIAFRIWLWWKGFYCTAGGHDFKYMPSVRMLVNEIYSSTLWAMHTNFTTIPELCFGSIERYTREFEGVPVRTGLEDKVNAQRVEVLRASIKSLAFLANVGLPAPIAALDEFAADGWMSTIDFKESGRFALVPQDLVLVALRSAIDFALDYGKDLLNAYVRIAIDAESAGMNVQSYCTEFGLNHLLNKKLKRLGIKTWMLGQTMSFSESNHASEKSKRAPADEFFVRFRANEGLFELIQVLFGAIQIVVGILTARRQGELMDLEAGNCLDSSDSYLIFHNRKTGIIGMRERELRPIPPIAVRVIKMLQELQEDLLKAGLISSLTTLFSMPHRSNYRLTTVSSSSYNKALDRACDYFRTGMNERNERYYLRQHLLRRFFATLFFWGKSFGGMDTLRWFLGHTDVQHLYHYVTESTPGAVLRWTKAMYVSDKIRSGETSGCALESLLEEKFNTRRFSLLDSEELTEYIDMLISDGTASVEPIFFDFKDGKDFKILIKVSKGHEHD